MSQTFNEFNQQIVQKGVFDLSRMHNKVGKWFQDNQYLYNEKDSTTKDKSHGKEVILVFSASRTVDDLARYDIKVEFFLLNLKKVKSGNKILDQGDMDIRIKADLVIDYKQQYASRLKSIFLNFYLKKIIKKRFEDYYEDKIFSDASAIFDMLKKEMSLSV